MRACILSIDISHRHGTYSVWDLACNHITKCHTQKDHITKCHTRKDHITKCDTQKDPVHSAYHCYQRINLLRISIAFEHISSSSWVMVMDCYILEQYSSSRVSVSMIFCEYRCGGTKGTKFSNLLGLYFLFISTINFHLSIIVHFPKVQVVVSQRSIDPFTVKVAQYLRGQVFEFRRVKK